MITAERLEALHQLWSTETDDEETQEWRYDLTEEEAALVDTWDSAYEEATAAIAQDILDMEKERGAV